MGKIVTGSVNLLNCFNYSVKKNAIHSFNFLPYTVTLFSVHFSGGSDGVLARQSCSRKVQGARA